LGKLNVGEAITYDQLNNAAGRNVQKEAYGALRTARNRLLRDDDKVFGVLRGMGLKRLNDKEAYEVGASGVLSIRRKSRKQLTILSKVNPSKLTTDEQIRMHATMSVFGAVNLFTRTGSLDKVANKIAQNENRTLPVGRVADLFTQ
jgi:hypothetical protein